MKRCAACGHEWTLHGVTGFSATCDGCGADVHACVNCRYHRAGSYRRCDHPEAEPPRESDRGNTCEFFQWREADDRPGGDKLAGDEARKRFDSLFGG
jgi:hypothetical protein